MQLQKILPKYYLGKVFNTDQSSLQLELFCNRTLGFEAEYLILAKVQSINNTTHSYTIQPMITMCGR